MKRTSLLLGGVIGGENIFRTMVDHVENLGIGDPVFQDVEIVWVLDQFNQHVMKLRPKVSAAVYKILEDGSYQRKWLNPNTLGYVNLTPEEVQALTGIQASPLHIDENGDLYQTGIDFYTDYGTVNDRAARFFGEGKLISWRTLADTWDTLGKRLVIETDGMVLRESDRIVAAVTSIGSYASDLGKVETWDTDLYHMVVIGHPVDLVDTLPAGSLYRVSDTSLAKFNAKPNVNVSYFADPTPKVDSDHLHYELVRFIKRLYTRAKVFN